MVKFISVLFVSCLSASLALSQSSEPVVLNNGGNITLHSAAVRLAKRPVVPESIDAPVSDVPALATPESVLSLSGVQAKVSLVTEVSSKLADGSPFEARLDEAIVKNGQVLLPQGTILHGHMRTTHARRLMRTGSLFMQFDRLLLPDGKQSRVGLNVVSSDTEAVKIGSEGQLRPAVSKKRLLIQLGATGLTAKFADDLAQVVGGTAVSASTARYLGAASAATFLSLQKGRDVTFHSGDKLVVEFGR